MALKLTLYDVIVGPVVTEKASELINTQKKVTLEVHPKATKPMIAEALEKLFNVKVAHVNTIVRKGKVRKVKRMVTCGKLTKHAIITLKDADSFDTLARAGAGAVPTEPVSVSENHE